MKKVILVTATQIDIGLRVIASILKPDFSIKYLNISQIELNPDDLIYREILLFLSQADFVLISAVDFRFDQISKLSDDLRETFKVPVIMGGVHAMLYPEECIRHSDAVCIGYADWVIKPLLNDWDNRFDILVPNFWYYSSQEIFKTKRLPLYNDIDRIPTPDYDTGEYYVAYKNLILNIENKEYQIYKHHQIGHPNTLVYSSDRGCPHSCSYCYNINLINIYGSKGYYRKKSIQNIIVELKTIIEAKGKKYQFLNLMNDNMASRTEEELELFADLYTHQIKLPFYCMVSPMELTEKKLDSLVRAGCVELNIGIQTNERTNIEIYKRKQTDSSIYKLSYLVSKYKKSLSVFYDFIINNPAESSGSLLRTIKLIRNLSTPCDIVSHHLCLGKGTILYNKFKENGIIPNDDSEIYNSDFHDFDKHISNYINDATFVENILVEWMSGPHGKVFQGRLHRQFSDFKESHFFYKWINGEDKLKVLTEKFSSTETIDFFIQNLVYLKQRVDLIVKLNGLLPKVEYSNFVKTKYKVE